MRADDRRGDASRVEDAGRTFERLKALVIHRTLHHYYTDKDELLAERLSRRQRTLGIGAPRYLALLEGADGAPAAEAEWRALEAEITVGETFFFRYVEQFAALADTILPALIRSRQDTRRLRIWSAGCSTGAEPYSVAILLHRLLGDALSEWRVSILGTDISEAALAAARQAEYGDWALRSLSESDRRRDFLPAPDGKRWRLRPAYRGMVRFERHNLADLIEGAGALQFTEYDLVLCRNVLIYFQPELCRALIARLTGSLSEDGWLLMGHAETGGLTPEGLEPVTLQGAMVWRRATSTGGGAPQPRVPAAPPAPSDIPPARLQPRPPPRTLRFRPAPRAAALPDSPPASPSGPSEADAAVIARVRNLADAGLYAEALGLCRDAINGTPPSARLFFYAAMLERAQGQDVAAEADFRRALYLCNQFVMAHYHLGLLLIDLGQVAAGRRAIAEAARIARGLPDEAALDDGDGMTAGRLRALARFDWLGGEVHA